MSSAIRKRRDVRRQPAFQEELARQRKISEQPFVNLADRKERVVALQQLFEKVPDVRTAMRLKILAQIRREVLDDKPIPHTNALQVSEPVQSRHTANGLRNRTVWPNSR